MPTRVPAGSFSRIVAVHLADPNMYIWPEINPGGLIDGYKQVLPSDWRMLASIPEAVHNRLEHVASAKQTPKETAARLEELAGAVERACERAQSRAPAANAEWRSSEPDFRVLALLARYHARKLRAAEQLEWFDRTGDAEALRTAKTEITAAAGVWEQLVRLTDGVYPVEMAFGPDDVGHWKDKTPYVRHDVELVREREEVFERFGRFDMGIDFGTAPVPARGAAYRNDPYVRGNHVSARFRQADAETPYSEETGFGWVAGGVRETVGIPVAPYLEVRAVAREPKHLPQNVLFRDYVRGNGPQYFRLKSGPGEYTVEFLHPDRTSRKELFQAGSGYLTIRFPEGAWEVSGLVITRTGQREPAPTYPLLKRLPRPAIEHVAPKVAQPGKPLTLTLRVNPPTGVRAVRLHYRAVNQLARFESIEATAPHLSFTIPGEAISQKWDLMYYFEVLDGGLAGWFEPDPETATPYFVVSTDSFPKP